jgi:integrase
MASIRCRRQTGTLFFDFRYNGERCREQTLLKDTPANRRKMQNALRRLEAEITLGTFDYRAWFPNSPMADKFEAMAQGADRYGFADVWQGIKPLKVPRTKVDPFSLEEVQRFLEAVRPDFRDYFIVRFFTGLRTAELGWSVPSVESGLADASC